MLKHGGVILILVALFPILYFYLVIAWVKVEQANEARVYNGLIIIKLSNTKNLDNKLQINNFKRDNKYYYL